MDTTEKDVNQFLASELHNHVTHFIENLHKPSDAVNRNESLSTADGGMNRLFHQTQSLSLQSILAVLQEYFVQNIVTNKGEMGGCQQDSTPYVPIRAGGTNLGSTIQTLLPYLSVGYSRKALTPVVQHVEREVSDWIRNNVRLTTFTGTLFHADRRSNEGIIKICRLALYQSYPNLIIDGLLTCHTHPPVIYISPASPASLEDQLSLQLGVGRSSVTRLEGYPDSKSLINIENLQRLMAEDKAHGRKPILLLAYSGTPYYGSSDNLTVISDICTTEGMWLHLQGDNLSNLILSHPNTDQTALVSQVAGANSVTMDIGLWFGLLTLPSVTLFRQDEATIPHPDILQALDDQLDIYQFLLPLVVWSSLLYIGPKSLLQTVDYAGGLAEQMVRQLNSIPSMVVINPEVGSFIIRFAYRGPNLAILKRKRAEEGDDREPTPKYVQIEVANDFQSVILNTVINSFPSLNLITDISPSGLKCWVFDVHRSFTESGADMGEIDRFSERLRVMVEELDATLLAREMLKKHLHDHNNMFVVDAKGLTSAGLIHYMPSKFLSLQFLTREQLYEVNQANRKLAEHMTQRNPAFTTYQIEDYSYVEVGRVRECGESLVIAFNEMKNKSQSLEKEAIELDKLSDQVKEMMDIAGDQLIEEQDKAFWEEGMVRKVPLVGSLINWISPINPTPKGRSYNLVSGVMQSTEPLYETKAQLLFSESLETGNVQKSPKSTEKETHEQN